MVNWFNLLVSTATPFTVLILSYQLWQRKKQFTTEFEDHLTDKYRDIIYRIPTEALLRDTDADTDEYAGKLKDYYRYIDLTNEEIFLRQEGRVSKSTWVNWKVGIETHLDRPDFENAWEELQAQAPDSFNELRDFEDDRLSNDPRYWDHPWRARVEDAWYRFWNF